MDKKGIYCVSMTSRTHDAIAFASLITAAVMFPLPRMNLLTAIGAIIAADIGASIPDMDTAGNRLWEFLPQGDKAGKVLRNVFYKHRTFTHSILGVYTFYRLFEWLLPTVFNTAGLNTDILLWSIMIGIVSHLIADSFTEEGIPLFFPFQFTFGLPPVKKIRIKTGRWFEHLVVYPAVWVYLGWLVYTNEAHLLGIVQNLTG